jgi:hypothetical protein
MSGFDEYAGYIGLSSFTRKLVALLVAAVIVGADVAWLVR